MHHEDTCGSITLSCSECALTYSRRDAPSHTENKCFKEQLRQLRQEFADKMRQNDMVTQQLSETISHQNEIIETLRQKFATDQQRQDQAMEKLVNQLTQVETKLTSMTYQLVEWWKGKILSLIFLNLHSTTQSIAIETQSRGFWLRSNISFL